MAERDIQDDLDWIVGPDGFTFHEHDGIGEYYEEMKRDGEIFREIVRRLSEDTSNILERIIEVDVMRPEGSEFDF